MADNIELNAGTGGATIAADDITSVWYQRVKLTDGTADSTTVIASGDGTATNALRVTVASDSSPLSVDDNGSTLSVDDGAGSLTVDNAALSVTGGGVEATALRVTLASDSTGVVSVDDNGGALTVDNGGTFAVQVDGAALTALQLIDNIVLAEDAAHVTADPGVQMLAVRKATPANLSDADGDYEPLQVSAGRVWASATIDAALPAGTNAIGKLAANTGVTIGAVEIAATQTLATVTTVSTLTGGGVAHDSADSGNPHKIGAKAETSPKGITPVADGDRTDLLADSDGMLMVKIGTSGADLISEAVSDTAGTSTAFTNFSAVASTYNYVTAYSIFRTDSGTTPIYVDFRDGAAGSVKYRVVIPPNGGANMASAIPLFKTSANTALAYDVSAATTTVYISISGYQSKV